MKRIITAFFLCIALLFSVFPCYTLAEDAGLGNTIYLSDIEWVSWKMFGGTSQDAAPPYQPSRNCNEAGGVLTIAGVQYEKGLRTHPGVGYDAEFVYDISAYGAATFKATVGKDSAGGAGNVKFMVAVDGVIKAESPLVPLGESYDITCDVTGGKTLTLYVNEGDDGYGGDSAGWGSARLEGCTSTPDKPEIPDDKGLKPMENYAYFIEHLEDLPVSFVYDGVKYSGLGSDNFEEISRVSENLSNGVQTVITLTHKQSGVKITLDTTVYEGYSAYEWTLYFTNTSEENTGVFSEIKGADTWFYGENPVLSGINGDMGSHYSEYSDNLNSKKTFVSTSGRPSHSTFPYYRLSYGNGGTFIAIGWPGTYKAEFEKLTDGATVATRFSAGQNGINTYLAPGETVRTPLMAFVNYENKDDDGAFNQWRKWFIDCNMRKQNGENMRPILTASTSWLYACMTAATEQNQISAITKYQEYGIDLDYWWMDAGWYLGAQNNPISALDQSGNWKVDPNRFPTLLKAISDKAAEYDMGTILWFEPELFRLSLSEIMSTNPDFKEEWVLGNLKNNGKLNDFGNEEFRKWMLATVNKIMDDGGITIYRQDFNEDPGAVWAQNDGENRNGITENKYCQGYLAYWDAIIASDPDRIIDNCASGGGRLDLESMRRSVILHRTDMGVGDDNLNVSMSASLAKWIVYFGTSTNDTASDSIDRNHLRSVFAPSMTLNYNIERESLNWPLLSAVTKEWNTVKRFYYNDYYELCDWNYSNTQWMAWEYFDADADEGVIQAFCPENGTTELTVKLKGLKADETYVLTDFEKKNNITATGAELAAGYTITLAKHSATTIYIGKAAIEVPDYQTIDKVPDGYNLDLTIPEGAAYVSDMPCKSWIMFGGASTDSNPPYRPSFNCNEAGGTLTIAGIGFEKGIRTHVSERTLTADLVYDITGCGYNTFRSVVGKDSAGLSGRVQFQVLVDGVIKAESPILYAGEAFQLTADITGGKELILRATDGGDLFTNDSVGWGSAILYNRALTPHEEVEKLINDIGNVTLTDECKALIDAADAAFNALTDAQKEEVTNKQTLDDAKAKYADLAAVKAVEDLIDAIGEVTKDSGAAITDAENAYNALTEGQKAMVNADKATALAKAREDFDKLNAVKYGDINGTGEITADDALLALQMAVGKFQPTEEQAKAANVDGEGEVTATDALLILQYVVGKIDKFPVEDMA